MSTQGKPNLKPAPLGRGLSALFGDADASYSPRPMSPNVQPKDRPQEAAPRVDKLGTIATVPTAWLQPGPFQARRLFKDDELKELAQSIRERGILQPLLVREAKSVGGEKRFDIIAGERRWRAAQLAALHEVPVFITVYTDEQAMEFGLIENVQREDLSPLEEAEGYQRLIEEFQHTQDNIAKVIGKSRSHIANMLRILSLPPGVKQLIDTGLLTAGHARALVTARDPLALAKEVVAKGLSVRQTELLAKAESDVVGTKAAPKKDVGQEQADVVGLEKELERVIGLKVKIHAQGKAGSLTLFYKDLDQLDEIIKRLRA